MRAHEMGSSVPGVPMSQLSPEKLQSRCYRSYRAQRDAKIGLWYSLDILDVLFDIFLMPFHFVSLCFTLFLGTAEGTRYTTFVLVPEHLRGVEETWPNALASSIGYPQSPHLTLAYLILSDLIWSYLILSDLIWSVHCPTFTMSGPKFAVASDPPAESLWKPGLIFPHGSQTLCWHNWRLQHDCQPHGPITRLNAHGFVWNWCLQWCIG